MATPPYTTAYHPQALVLAHAMAPFYQNPQERLQPEAALQQSSDRIYPLEALASSPPAVPGYQLQAPPPFDSYTSLPSLAGITRQNILPNPEQTAASPLAVQQQATQTASPSLKTDGVVPYSALTEQGSSDSLATPVDEQKKPSFWKRLRLKKNKKDSIEPPTKKEKKKNPIVGLLSAFGKAFLAIGGGTLATLLGLHVYQNKKAGRHLILGGLDSESRQQRFQQTLWFGAMASISAFTGFLAGGLSMARYTLGGATSGLGSLWKLAHHGRTTDSSKNALQTASEKRPFWKKK